MSEEGMNNPCSLQLISALALGSRHLPVFSVIICQQPEYKAHPPALRRPSGTRETGLAAQDASVGLIGLLSFQYLPVSRLSK